MKTIQIEMVLDTLLRNPCHLTSVPTLCYTFAIFLEAK